MKLALLGYGRMGREVERLAIAQGHEVGVRLDIDDNAAAAGITAEAFASIDAAIDFSVPAAVFDNIDRATYVGVPLVVGTTGWDDRLADVRRLVDERAAAVVYGANLSIGANLFFRIVEHAARLFDAVSEHADYDPYVLEHHHRGKLDTPSGTALHLADLVIVASSAKNTIQAGNPEASIDVDALHVASLRAGAACGEHTVGFDGSADTVRLTHTARNREGFAAGALLAARWIVGKKGCFEFSSVLDEILARNGTPGKHSAPPEGGR